MSDLHPSAAVIRNSTKSRCKRSCAAPASVFLGRELGVRSANPVHYVDSKVQYRSLAQEPTFRDGLQRIRTGAENLRIALGERHARVGAAAEKRLMSTLNIVPDMFHGEVDCIERAYDAQADRIAYVRPV
jgi:hypothetical protein